MSDRLDDIHDMLTDTGKILARLDERTELIGETQKDHGVLLREANMKTARHGERLNHHEKRLDKSERRAAKIGGGVAGVGLLIVEGARRLFGMNE